MSNIISQNKLIIESQNRRLDERCMNARMVQQIDNLNTVVNDDVIVSTSDN
jgi:molybdopterin converting factor small subunit